MAKNGCSLNHWVRGILRAAGVAMSILQLNPQDWSKLRACENMGMNKVQYKH